MSMTPRSRFHRSIAIIMVIAMPMCCCVLNAAAFGSCCIPAETAPVVTMSCCSGQACSSEADSTPVESPPCQDSNCSCCLKAPVQAFEWTPPNDTIGSITPLLVFQVTNLCCITSTPMADLRRDYPPPRPAVPDGLDGHVILQV